MVARILPSIGGIGLRASLLREGAVPTTRSSLARFAALIALFGALHAASAIGDSQTVVFRGEFAQIDTHLANETMQLLDEGTSDEKRKVIARIRAKPEDYAPPVLYVLSNVLFAAGEQDEGAFWFYAGQLRARIDANICADSSAREAVGVLNQLYGSPINQYAFQDILKLEQLVSKVLEWERRTPYKYDRRWINLFGMDAMTASLGAEDAKSGPRSLSLPDTRWSEIAEETRAEYLRTFREVASSIGDDQ